MKINTSCVLKYLKHDYNNIFSMIIPFIIICCAGLLAIIVVLNTQKIIELIFSYIELIFSYLPAIPSLSAYMLLNIISAMIVITSTLGIAIFGNREWFEYKPWKEGYGWGPKDFETKGSGIFFFPIFGVGSSIYLIYWIEYLLFQNWESPLLSTIIFIALILIGTPIGCAIARCKEE